MVERFRDQLTTEKLAARIERMVADLERAAQAYDRTTSCASNRLDFQYLV
jgi:hypothetical protein